MCEVGVGGEGDAGEVVVGGIVEALETDEAAVGGGLDGFLIAVGAFRIDTNEEEVGPHPAHDVHKVTKAKENEGAGFGEKKEVGVADDD